jgi:hypothetical protein
MAIEVPHKLVEFILLGPEDDRRQLQDSPILGDVWLAFAKTPDAQLQLLITPYKDNAAGKVATILDEWLQKDRRPAKSSDKDADVAFLQGIVAARLRFEEVLRYIVPMTYWWRDKPIQAAIAAYRRSRGTMKEDINRLLRAYMAWAKPKDEDEVVTMQDIKSHVRYIALAGLILWAQKQDAKIDLLDRLLDDKVQEAIVVALREQLEALDDPPEQALVWHVARNRPASAALTKSVPAVKADSARSLFTVSCKELVWAVIDSGIDAEHDAFKGADGKTRVRKAFDFTRIRDIFSLDNARPGKADERIGKLLGKHLKDPPGKKDAAAHLTALAEDAKKGRAINWELVERLIEIDPKIDPPSNHGTHVAGIIAASREGGVKGVKKGKKAAATPPVDEEQADDAANGMCPDIALYDFRVLAPTLRETEFAIIAALQYIRYINERNSFMTIHGANLSLSIRHDVRNYACGRTPVCNECERLVNSGVVVVAAAGNRGYQNFETKEGVYESYAAFSVTDPGNADGVVTVGATHRYWPHTYGVSFFSSRGPTGDGRMKPDLVAPGERIRAPLPGGGWGDLDGTSMAAPHVSGAAAMLMARYSELVGQPRRIKQILCNSATDLGREKSFQGHGMLDVLRAFQSI